MRADGVITAAIGHTSWQWYDWAIFGAGMTILAILAGTTVTARRKRRERSRPR